MIMGEVCFEFWGPDESRIYSEVPMGGSLAVWLGGGSWFQRNLEQYLGGLWMDLFRQLWLVSN